jgi:hypothetical protein
MVITENEFNERLAGYENIRPARADLREDIKFRGLAKILGWDILYGNDFGDSLMFRKGTKTIYFCQYGWRCGDSAVNSPDTPAIDRKYNDYPHLDMALQYESISAVALLYIDEAEKVLR